MQVFPAIDLLDGKAVRLEQGRPESAKIYSHAPWELARKFAAAGAPRLHVVDLDAALSGGAKHNHETIQKILAAAGDDGSGSRRWHSHPGSMRAHPLARRQVRGHGNRGHQDAQAVVKEACKRYPKRIVVAVDARAGKVAVEGWKEDTDSDAVEIGKQVANAGAAAVLYTDIGRDGMRTGPNLEATARLAATIKPCAVIASGGMSKLDDIHQVRKTGATSVVIGKALYEGAFTIEEALAAAAAKGK
jgi:phosphoribosylformimino-5-aminoimidazole carboxamide ribotide isomerase